MTFSLIIGLIFALIIGLAKEDAFYGLLFMGGWVLGEATKQTVKALWRRR